MLVPRHGQFLWLDRLHLHRWARKLGQHLEHQILYLGPVVLWKPEVFADLDFLGVDVQSALGCVLGARLEVSWLAEVIPSRVYRDLRYYGGELRILGDLWQGCWRNGVVCALLQALLSRNSHGAATSFWRGGVSCLRRQNKSLRGRMPIPCIRRGDPILAHVVPL